MGIEITCESTPAPEQVGQLFYKAFNRELDGRYWEWRFERNIASSKKYIACAYAANELIAYYAVSPTRISINGKNELLALSNMTMTDPAHAGKGLFRTLAAKLYTALQIDGFLGVYGFANANSHYGFRKYLNWHDLTLFSLLNLRQSSHQPIERPEGYRFEAGAINADHCRVFADLSREKSVISFDRSPEFLKWRYVDIPDRSYRVISCYHGSGLAGAVIFKKYMADIDLMDFFFADGLGIERFDVLKAILSYIFEAEKCEVINWSANLFSEEHLALEKLGFRYGSIQSYLGIIPLVPHESTLLDYSKWRIGFADSDVF